MNLYIRPQPLMNIINGKIRKQNFENRIIFSIFNCKFKKMSINKILLDLATTFSTLTHVETIEVLAELVDVRDELNSCLRDLKLDSTELEMRLNKMMEIEEQIILLNKNIRTLENALLCHESKIFERINLNGVIAVLCYN